MNTLEPYSNRKEEEIVKFWKKERIMEKARDKSAKNKEKFYFMDGPPYATGHIHMGTTLNKTLKDISMRYARMNGKDVFDRPLYDTHGVPIEFKVEQELGFKSKDDIENYGVDKFIAKCREFATKFIGTMNEEFQDLGVWMDWENTDMTLTNKYMEGIWYAFKKAYEKGLLYLGKYPIHACPRCETAVSFNEIEYHKSTDTSVYVKFKVEGRENTYLIIWTTTPWTLPANTGVMIHPDYEYSFLKVGNEEWIVANELAEKVMAKTGFDYKIEKTVKGRELEGMHYANPLSKHMKLPEKENAYRVVLSKRYVNLEEGTGLVHTAPGHGKEDYDAGKENNLPIITPINLGGIFQEEAGKYTGKKARVVDKEIIEDLKEDNALVMEENYTHDYPMCWRCKSHLLMMSAPQWFFKISDIQDKMIKENEKVNWVPAWGKDRFRNWLEGIGDWPVSRKRYWGTPLPIWICNNEECQEKVVVGSLEELSKHVEIPDNFDAHKPGIDNLKFPCKKCKGEMQRVPEVLDVWFDSGASSWAILGYPSNNELFDKYWPADFNVEGTDQFRGWWNSQMILSTICFDKKPFETIMVHGLVLDVSKRKMSKSIGNIIQPNEVIEKYNRDYLRYFMAKTSRGEDFAFDWNAFKDINRFYNVFWNTYNYIKLYLEFNPEDAESANMNLKEMKMEDAWILSRLNNLIKEVRENYEGYTYSKGILAMEHFILEDLSRTYIKLVRDRIGSESQEAVRKTLNYCTISLLKMLSPITPHITEYIYQDLKEESMPESIHLNEFAKEEKQLINKGLEEEMDLVKAITQTALSVREENKLRLRWPLKELLIVSKTSKCKVADLKEVLAKMCNVKEASQESKKPEGNYAEKEVNDEVTIYLNIEADYALKDEWELRELVRKVQDKRKKMKLNPNDIIEMNISCSQPEFLEKFKEQIEKETNTKIKVADGNKEKVLEKEFFIELKP